MRIEEAEDIKVGDLYLISHDGAGNVFLMILEDLSSSSEKKFKSLIINSDSPYASSGKIQPWYPEQSMGADSVITKLA